MRSLFFLLLILTACQDSPPIEVVGLKLRSVYQRDLNRWSLENSGRTHTTRAGAYPVTLRSAEGTVRGKLSIRGDLNKHWRHTRKSYKFVAEKDTFFRGLSEVDLIIAEDKARELEPFAYDLAGSLGLLTPRWFIANLVLNHRDDGHYLLVERFTPASMETRGLPEGEIVREDNAWLDVLRVGADSRYHDVFRHKDRVNPLQLRHEIYRSTFDGPHTPFALDRFKHFLHVLPDGRWQEFIDTDEAVDWLIIMAVFGSYHGVLGDNMKWYYHPYERKFHPIPYDLLPTLVPAGTCVPLQLARMNPWAQAFLRGKDFRTRFKARVRALSAAGWPENRLAAFYRRRDVIELAGANRQKHQALVRSNWTALLEQANNKSCL